MTKCSFVNIIPIGKFVFPLPSQLFFPQTTAVEAGVGNIRRCFPCRSPTQICFYGIRTDAYLVAMATVFDQVQMVCCNIKTECPNIPWPDKSYIFREQLFLLGQRDVCRCHAQKISTFPRNDVSVDLSLMNVMQSDVTLHL